MVQGRKANMPRRQYMAQLRSQGWTLQQIAEHLGISRQAVSQTLRSPPPRQPLPVRCNGCGNEILSIGTLPGDHKHFLCISCLTKQPDAPFSQRLRTFRLVANLTRTDLERQAKISPNSVRAYEEGERIPRRQTLNHLARVLGKDLLVLDGQDGSLEYHNNS